MFWPLCRSCLGEEALPAAFLSREPTGEIKGEMFLLVTCPPCRLGADHAGAPLSVGS